MGWNSWKFNFKLKPGIPLYLSCSYTLHDTFKGVLPLLQIDDHEVTHNISVKIINKFNLRLNFQNFPAGECSICIGKHFWSNSQGSWTLSLGESFRDLLKILPIMLCCTAQKLYLLCSMILSSSLIFTPQFPCFVGK